MKRQKVAVIGRMNVGKSTLFNRLTESNKAIVSSWAGTTRDTNSGLILWRGYEMELIDTGGLDVEDDEQLEERVISHAERAMREADAILFVIDGRAGVMPQEKELAKVLRTATVPVILAVNKVDNNTVERQAISEMHALGFEHTHMVSAKNGRGTGDLLDVIYEMIKPQYEADTPDRRTKVAIVGRPNVGKSSMLNAILGEDRVIVADQAHTTRDTNDIPYSYKGRDFLLIDTAGIRRRKKVGKKWGDVRLGEIEKHSVSGSIEAMRRADVVLLVVEAHKRITAQDKKIADLANEHGKALIIVVNKWDTIEDKDSNTINEFINYFDISLPFLRWAPMIFTSATEQLRVLETLDLVVQVTENYERRIDQEVLDEVLEAVKRQYRPKQSQIRKYRKKVAKMTALTQTGIQPPRFFFKVSRPKEVPAAMIKIMERELRDRVDLDGVRIVIEMDK